MVFHKIFAANMTNNMQHIQQQIEHLFQLAQALDHSLSAQDFDQFKTLEMKYSQQLKKLLDKQNKSALLAVIEDLKKLEQVTGIVQGRAKQSFLQLKEQSLLQKRNKSKIKAYK